MAADKQIYKAFRKDMERLAGDLEFGEHFELVRARIMDRLAHANIRDSATLRELRALVSPAFKGEFGVFSAEIFRSYNDVIEFVNDHYSSLGVDLVRDFNKLQAVEKIQRTRLGRYEDWEIKRIAKHLRTGLRKGENHIKIARRLWGISDGVTYYSETIARTQVKGYGQVCKNEKALIGEVVWFEYVGIIRKHTREFCLNLLQSSDSTFHLEDIRKMDNGKGQLKPVFAYRGGWNCHHDWEPDPFYNEE